MKEYPFYTAYTQARELYGLEMKPDDFETVGLIAWSKIGNRKTRLYLYSSSPKKWEDNSWYIDLPCNVDLIEAVTTSYEGYQNTSSINANTMQNSNTEEYIEDYKSNTNHLYISGKFIKYTKEGQKIFFRDNVQTVNILYHGIITDDEGLPSLDEKELDAVAVFCAYTTFFKKGLVNQNATTLQFAQVLENKWKTMCTQARVADHLSQNEVDEILNVSTSWDRKRYGQSYKPLR